jgi:predicted TIM-barrel fold metal-dependent hydrolase
MIIDFNVEIGNSIEFKFSLEELIKIMNENNIDKAIVSPIRGRYYIDLFKEANKYIKNSILKYKDRLYGFAVVNPWFNNEAIIELRKSIKEYNFKGLKLFPSIQGYKVNHEIIYPLMEEVKKLKIPIFIPSGYPPSTPLQIADLAEVFPEVNIIMGHSGFTTFWLELLPAMKRCENLYGELSCQTNVRALKEVIEKIGVERFLYGSSLPFSHPIIEIEKIKLLNLSKEEEEKILWKNALKLLNIKSDE